MKKFVGFLLASIMLVQFANAEQSARVATIDVSRIIQDSKLGKAAQATLEKEAVARKGSIDNLRKEIEGLKLDIGKQEKLLSAEALERKREALRERETAAVRKVEDEREAMERIRREALQSVVARLDKEVERLGKEEQFSFIMDKDEAYVVYSSPRIDLTERVIAAMDK